MTEPARIIIVEDEVPLARAIARSLELDGYHTALAPSAAEFRRIYRNEGADLVLLDLNLGADDGLDLARELAQTTAVAVIILTGRADPDERIRGLDAGADDYVTKPFEVGELRARVRAVLRRRRPGPNPELRLRVGPVLLDLVMREVRSDGGGQPVELTETQADILAQLMRNVGRPGRPAAPRQLGAEQPFRRCPCRPYPPQARRGRDRRPGDRRRPRARLQPLPQGRGGRGTGPGGG